MKKKILAVVLFTTMITCLFAGCGNALQSSQEGSKDAKTASSEADSKKETLKVGLSGDYPPFEFYTSGKNGRELVGVDVELANYIADAMGKELELTDMSFDGLIGSLNEDKFDLVISGMTIRADRDCLFSDPYYTADQALLVKSGNEDKYASLDELKGQKIGGQMGALQQKLAKKYAGSTAQIVNNVQDMIMMLQEGKLDGMFCEKCVAESAVAKNSELAIANIEVPTEKNDVGVCIKKGNTELLDEVNKAIEEVNQKKLVGEWMNQYIDVKEDAK